MAVTGEPCLLLDAGFATLATLNVASVSGVSMLHNFEPYTAPQTNTQFTRGQALYAARLFTFEAVMEIAGSVTYPEDLLALNDDIQATKHLERFGYRLPIRVGLGIDEGWEPRGGNLYFNPVFIAEESSLSWTHKTSSNTGIMVL